MNNHNEYTERVKEMRINEIEAGAILEGAREHLVTAQSELLRLAHSIETAITNVENAVNKLIIGGMGNNANE